MESIDLSGKGDIPCNMERVHLDFFTDDYGDCKSAATLKRHLKAVTSTDRKVILIAITAPEMKQFKLAKQIAKLPCICKFTAPSRHRTGLVTIMLFRIRR